MKIAIIGTGLIGASLGLALKQINDVEQVAGIDTSEEDLIQAENAGAIDKTIRLDELGAYEIIFLAVPPSAFRQVLHDIKPHLSAGTIITDVASVKGKIVDEMHEILPDNMHIIGGHPMAGSHLRGAKAAVPDMFIAATWLLTPVTGTDLRAVEKLNNLITSMGARPIILEPYEHDTLVAIVSHLPQMAASTLMALADDRSKRENAKLLFLAAGGFRDATRVAASDPDLWLDIAFANKEAIMAVLDEYGARLGQIRMLLHDEDTEGMRRFLGGAREARDNMPGRENKGGQWVELRIVLPDRPGSLAYITKIFADNDINIEDFGISHAPDGGQGRMRVTIAGTKQADLALQVLQKENISVFARNL